MRCITPDLRTKFCPLSSPPQEAEPISAHESGRLSACASRDERDRSKGSQSGFSARGCIKKKFAKGFFSYMRARALSHSPKFRKWGGLPSSFHLCLEILAKSTHRGPEIWKNPHLDKLDIFDPMRGGLDKWN